SPKQLTYYTIMYVNLKSIPAMISETINDKYWIDLVPDITQRIDRVVFSILNNVRHWFDYKLPKWLGTVSSLQKYVFRKHSLPYGDYTYLASMLDNGFLQKEIATLLDLDIPHSALRKLHPAFPSVEEAEAENILGILGSLDLTKYGLNAYEMKKIRAIL
ncbi:MAG TPA: hypothetical protein VGA79_01055, partial [Desulfobaccales bacterium]